MQAWQIRGVVLALSAIVDGLRTRWLAQVPQPAGAFTSQRQAWLGQVLGCLLVLMAALLIGVTGFMRQHFGPVTPDQVIYHLSHGGVEWADAKILQRGFRWCLGAIVLAGLVAWVIRRAGKWVRRSALALLLGTTGWSLWATVATACIVEPGQDPLQGYADPAAQRFSQIGPSPDLLIVFVESLEEGYAETSAFGEVLVPGLVGLRAQHQDFGDLQQIRGASWTMAGMFATLCGLPLQSVGLNTSKGTEFASHFFGGGRCLTDVLHERGWETAFYGAASLTFAGKGRFLAEHGVQYRFGRQEWQALGLQAPDSGWGLRDSTMVEAAWRHMTRPDHPQRPRAHIVLTVDTHGPQGVVDARCRPDLAAQTEPDPAAVMRAALQCSDRAVTQLIERFATHRTGRPKVALVMGDHLSTPHPLSGPLESQAAHQRRSVFHLLARWDATGRPIAAAESSAPRQFTHLDLMPTVAEALGLRWQPQPHRLGLGVSLLAARPVATRAEQFGTQNLDRLLSCPSPMFQSLWTRPPPARVSGSVSTAGL
jgi:phosphoglycerol transferase